VVEEVVVASGAWCRRVVEVVVVVLCWACARTGSRHLAWSNHGRGARGVVVLVEVETTWW